MLASELIDRAIGDLHGPVSEELNQLSSTIGDTDTVLSVNYDISGLRQGSIITIDNEVMRVWSVDSTAKTATVQRGYRGTTATTHANGSLIYVNPRISRPAAFQALNDEIIDLSSPVNGLFRIEHLAITPSANVSYDLPGVTNFISGWRLQQKQPALNEWINVAGWSITAGQDTTDYSSGLALNVASLTPGWKTQLLYRAEFTPLASFGDDVTAASGVTSEMFDILRLGILIRLGPMAEIRRNFTEAQGNARRAEEVPPTAISNSFRGLQMQHQQRVNAEAARLMRLYP